MSWRNRVEVSYGALRHNLQTICAAAGNRAVIAVAKADAYGLGLERCARIYHDNGASAIAVAALREADRVRSAVPGARVILLGSPLPEERPAVAASGYEVVISGEEEIHEFAHLASPGSPAKVHLAIDTGMGRAGCSPSTAPALAKRILEDPNLRLKGVATHYPMALNDELSAAGESLFNQALDAIGPLPEDCWIHRANSEGLLMRPADRSTAVRVGILLSGGVDPACPDPGLRFAVRWVSSVSLVKCLPQGHGISYNQTHLLDRDTTVCLIPVGYADGYPIGCSGRGAVLIQGRRCPILGRVTMDYLMVDATDLNRAPIPGDQVVLLGEQEGASISLFDMAHWAQTISYDILCGLRGRCEVVGVA